MCVYMYMYIQPLISCAYHPPPQGKAGTNGGPGFPGRLVSGCNMQPCATSGVCVSAVHETVPALEARINVLCCLQSQGPPGMPGDSGLHGNDGKPV